MSLGLGLGKLQRSLGRRLHSMPVCADTWPAGAAARCACLLFLSLAGRTSADAPGLQAIELLVQQFGKDDARAADCMAYLALFYHAHGSWEASEVCATLPGTGRREWRGKRSPPLRLRMTWLLLPRAVTRRTRCTHKKPRNEHLVPVPYSLVHLQAWFVRALDAMRAARGPADPVTISAVISYGQCLGESVGWQQAAKMLGDSLAQLKASGLHRSEGEPALPHAVSCMAFEGSAVHLGSHATPVLPAALQALRLDLLGCICTVVLHMRWQCRMGG